MKKILAFAIALSLCTTGLYIPNKFNLTLSNINANAETSASDFDFDADTGTIKRYIGSDTIVEIPSTINGVTVKKIGDDAFFHCNNVTDIIIPNTVTNIGDRVFVLCNSLSNIAIPESVTTIGNNFIHSCMGLKNIFIPASVTSIGECTFGLSYYGITITGYENTAAQKLAEESGKTFISLGTAPEKSKYILGEVTGDGIIDATDASFILTAYAKSSINEDDGMSEEQRKIADVNSDDVVDAVDASAVLTFYALSSTGNKQTFEEYISSLSTPSTTTLTTTTYPITTVTTTVQTQILNGFVTENEKLYYYKNGSKLTQCISNDYIIDSDGVCHSYRFPSTGNNTQDARKIAQVIAECTGTGTDFQRVKRAASMVDLFVAQSAYKTSGSYYSTAYGVFIKKECSCAGATRALGMVLEYMGFSWQHMNENQYTHQWCKLTMDGKIGYADALTPNATGEKVTESSCYVGYGQHMLETGQSSSISYTYEEWLEEQKYVYKWVVL